MFFFNQNKEFFMKNILYIALFMFVAATTFAQAPNKISYQTVIRNASNALVSNQTVGVRISILSGSATGTAVYVETHNPVTNANGLASFQIGDGTVSSGTFANIDWSSNNYFVRTEVDPAGGTNYSITGTSELLSVPYALHAPSPIRAWSLGLSSNFGIIRGTESTLIWNQVNLSADNSYNSTTGVFTAPKDGLYNVQAYLDGANHGSHDNDCNFSLVVEVNGTDRYVIDVLNMYTSDANSSVGGGGYQLHLSGSKLLDLSAGDSFTFEVNYNTVSTNGQSSAVRTSSHADIIYYPKNF
jgi:hypothetical protein